MIGKKVFVITAKDEFELVKKLNLESKDFFATQPKQKKDGSWVCFCYSKGDYENKPKTRMATDKQLYYIHKNDLDIDTNKLTFDEASAIIKEYKGYNK